ncbi:ABC transporter permease [Georgenia yuyongxinii]|uniref:ABC transporter permease n=1 Tax=Georgenia yuyongxinii TaxID=2589797 RepID=A0A552WXL7_9MICO|nr:ABC transporter permease [Georgenia yuyongxinii]TRW47552.1 ABC transporter permease [Georgenia yuyongxinii]
MAATTLQRRSVAPAARPPRRQSRLRLHGMVGFAVLIAVGEIVGRSGIVPASYLPPSSVVLVRAGELLLDGEFLGHAAATLLAWVAGLALAMLLAVPVGILVGTSELAYRASSALVEFLRPIPSVALIPIAMLMLGTGTEMKVVLTVYAAFWPIFFNTISGVHDVDPTAKDTAVSFNYSRWGVLTRVTLPSAAPHIYTGVRIASAVVLVVAISAELLAGGNAGIGTLIFQASITGAGADTVYAATVLTGLLGLGINSALVHVERRMLFWKNSERKA